jgi:hypothetical protein
MYSKLEVYSRKSEWKPVGVRASGREGPARGLGIPAASPRSVCHVCISWDASCETTTLASLLLLFPWDSERSTGRTWSTRAKLSAKLRKIVSDTSPRVRVRCATSALQPATPSPLTGPTNSLARSPAHCLYALLLRLFRVRTPAASVPPDSSSHMHLQSDASGRMEYIFNSKIRKREKREREVVRTCAFRGKKCGDE